MAFVLKADSSSIIPNTKLAQPCIGGLATVDKTISITGSLDDQIDPIISVRFEISEIEFGFV